MPDSIVYDGANAWVTDYDSGAVSVVSSGGQLLSTIAIPGDTAIPGSPSNPEGMAFDGHYVWVANQYNSVTKIDANSRTIVGTYPVGRAPQAVAFDGKYIWVANGNSNAVWVLNPATGATVNGWATGRYPTNLLYDGTNMWVSNGFAPSLGFGSVTRIQRGWRRVSRNDIYHTRLAGAGTCVRWQVDLGLQLDFEHYLALANAERGFDGHISGGVGSARCRVRREQDMDRQLGSKHADGHRAAGIPSLPTIRSSARPR